MNREEIIKIIDNFWDEGKKVGIKRFEDDFTTTTYAINLFTYQDWERLKEKFAKVENGKRK